MRINGVSGGSFEVIFEAILSLSKQLSSLLSDQKTGTAVGIIGLILGNGGIFALIRFLRGRKPDKIEKIDNNSSKIIIGGENNTFNNTVINLIKKPSIREETYKLISPLSSDGVDELEIKDENNNSYTIEKKELGSFNLLEEYDDELNVEEKIIESEMTMVFDIIAPYFREGKKWRFYDGSRDEQVEIMDSEFITRVKNGEEIFSYGDYLKCLVKFRQWRTKDRIKSQYDIIKVLEHGRRAKQVKMFK